MINKLKFIFKLISWFVKMIYNFKKIKKSNIYLNKNIIVFTVSDLKVASYTHHLRDLIIAIYLKILGANVYIFYDDSFLEKDGVFEEYNSNYKISLTNIINFLFINILIFLFGIKKLTIKKIIYKAKLDFKREINNELQKLKYNFIKDHYYSSYRRKYRGREPEYYEEYGKFKNENKLIILNICTIRIISKLIFKIFNIETLITTHGIYSLWGPPVDIAKQLNIKTTIYYCHDSDDNKIYLEKDRAYYEMSYKKWINFKNLIDKENDKKNELLKNLQKKFKLNGKINNGNLLPKIKKEYKKIIGIFPSMLHDYAINERNFIFNSTIDWIIHIIDFCYKNNYYLIIREHPDSYEFFKEKDSIKNILKENNIFLENFSNIYLINSFDKLSSYHIINKIIDLGVLYDGTLSMEIPLLDCPTIIAANSRYKDKEFTYSFDNIQEYENLLFSLDKKYHRKKLKIHKKNALEEYFYEHNFKGNFFPFRVLGSEMKRRKQEKFYTLELDKIDFNINKNLLNTLKEIG